MFEPILLVSLLALIAITLYVAYRSIKKSYLEAKAEKQAILDAERASKQEASDKFYKNLESAEAKVANIKANLVRSTEPKVTKVYETPKRKPRTTRAQSTYRSREDNSVDDTLLATAAVVTAFATPSYESSYSSSSYDSGSSSSSSDSSSSSSSD